MSDHPSAAPLRQVGILALVAVVSVLTAFFGSRGLQSAFRAPPPVADSMVFPSGRYAVVYVVVSADCGFCKEKGTRAALAAIRPSLRAHQPSEFAAVRVVGVSIDEDITHGLAFLHALDGNVPAFDEISVGGSWLNSFVATWIWRARVARAATPTVIVVSRRVDATRYPRALSVSDDSVLFTVEGRSSLLDWVRRGTPFDTTRTP